MTAPKTLSVEELKEAFELAGFQVMDHGTSVSCQDEGMCLVSQALLQERRRTEELEKEVEKIKQDMHLTVSDAGKDLIKERDAAIEKAKKAEDELSACKESPGGCGYWRERARSLAKEVDELKLCPNEEWECKKIEKQLRSERDQALALAKSYREALEPTLKLYDYGIDYGSASFHIEDSRKEAHEIIKRVRNALDATPTSLLERFKADERIIETAKIMRREIRCMKLHGYGPGAFDEALEAREKLK